MKRLFVYVTYDPEGITDDFKIDTLRRIGALASEIVVVVNGELKDKEKFEAITKEICFRENKGYDLGAIKELFTGKLCPIYDKDWDEIVLMNDSVFGPFFDLAPVFQRMEAQNLACWSLGRYEPDGENVRYVENTVVPEHLQSYFLVFRREVAQSASFRKYWDEMPYPEDYEQAVISAEFRMMEYLKKNRISYSSFMDAAGCGELLHHIAVYEDIHRLVGEYGFPLIKRKIFGIPAYRTDVLLVMDYLQEHSDYELQLIEASVRRTDPGFEWKDLRKLREFVSDHDKIYIFGHGVKGGRIEEWMRMNRLVYRGFVVSEPKLPDEIALCDLRLEENDGLVVALGKKNTEEMRPILREHIDEKQLFFVREL